MISERTIRRDMAEEGHSDEEIEAAVAQFHEDECDAHYDDKEFAEDYPL